MRADDARLSASETRALQERFEKRQASLRSATVEFSQTLSLAGLRNPAVSRGRIFYATPGRLRIEYERPAGELLLLPGDGTLVTRKAGRASAVRALDRLDERTRRNLTLLLSLFEGKLPAGFAAARLEARREGDDRVVVTMTREPANGSATADAAERVDTTLAWPLLDPLAVSIRLAGGAGMRYDFGRTERNATLTADAFTPPLPP